MFISVPGVIVDGSSPITNTPQPQPLTLTRGVDTTIQVPVVGSNGTAINLTGYTNPKLTMKHGPNTPPAVQITGTIFSAVGGILQFAIPGALLTPLMPTNLWDVFITNPSGLRDEPVPNSVLTINDAAGA